MHDGKQLRAAKAVPSTPSSAGGSKADAARLALKIRPVICQLNRNKPKQTKLKYTLFVGPNDEHSEKDAAKAAPFKNYNRYNSGARRGIL
jgi:hypothetical protein